jgi:cytochrome c-type biogenesis protein
MIEIGFAGALLGGLLTLLSPCSVMLLPSFFSYAFTSPQKLLARTGVFFGGLLTTLVPIGALAGSLGAFFVQNRSTVTAIAAAIVIAFGLVQIAGLRVPGITRGASAEGTSVVSVYLLGAVYGVAGVCAGPILGSILTISALGGSPVYGAVLLCVYALGMAVPLFILALTWRKLRLQNRGWLRPRVLTIARWTNSWTSIVSGVLLVGLGVLLLVTNGTSDIVSILGVSEQFAVESWARDVTGTIPNIVFAVAASAILIAVAGVFALRRRSRAGD